MYIAKLLKYNINTSLIIDLEKIYYVHIINSQTLSHYVKWSHGQNTYKIDHYQIDCVGVEGFQSRTSTTELYKVYKSNNGKYVC